MCLKLEIQLWPMPPLCSHRIPTVITGKASVVLGCRGPLALQAASSRGCRFHARAGCWWTPCLGSLSPHACDRVVEWECLRLSSWHSCTTRPRINEECRFIPLVKFPTIQESLLSLLGLRWRLLPEKEVYFSLSELGGYSGSARAPIRLKVSVTCMLSPE